MNNSAAFRDAVELAERRLLTDKTLLALKRGGYKEVFVGVPNKYWTMSKPGQNNIVAAPDLNDACGWPLLWRILDSLDNQGGGNGLRGADNAFTRKHLVPGHYDLTTWEPTYVDP